MKQVKHWTRCRTFVTGVTVIASVMASPIAAQQTVAHDDRNANDAAAEAVLDRKVTVDLSETSLEHAIQTVAKLGQATVLINRSALDRYTKTVTLHATGESLRSIFTRLFASTSLQVVARPGARLIVIDGADVSSPSVRRDTTGTVSGIVIDSATGKPIASAIVRIDELKLSTSTADNGRFVFSGVPVGDRIVRVKILGFRAGSQTVTVTKGETAPVRIALTTAPMVLSGVVTTASGPQQRTQVGTDITVLNADSIQRIAPVTTVTQMLENRVPGLFVQRTTGQPGAPSRLRLRGTSSPERNNDPILIVDGIRVYANQSGNGNNGDLAKYPTPSPLDQLDPNTIETIEVFKGPSASALYGSDAGNGVIVVTTKRGKPGKTHWDAGFNFGRSTLPKGGYPVNYYQFGHQFNQPSDLTACAEYKPCIRDSLVAFQALNLQRFSPFGTGNRREQNLTVSGGAGPMAYSVTGSLANEDGILKLSDFDVDHFAKRTGFAAPGWMRRPDQYDTKGINSRVDLQLGTTGGVLAITNSVFRSLQGQSNLSEIISVLSTRYIDTSTSNGIGQLQGYGFGHRVQNKTWTTTTGADLSWPVFSWLPLKVTAGLNLANTDYADLLSRGYVEGIDSIGFFESVRGNTNVQTLSAGTVFLLSSRGRVPGMRVPVGFNLTSESFTRTQGSTINETGINAGVPAGVTSVSALHSTVTGSDQTTYGWYVAPTLDLNSRVFVSPGLRFDGGSASGSNSGSFGGLTAFPKLDLSWIAIDQSERPIFGAITMLRPRIAFGIAGVQPAPDAKLRTFRTRQTTMPDGSVVTEANIAGLGNTQLHPERSREFEGGFDAELWNQRLTFGLTGYHKLRFDAILTVPLPPSITTDPVATAAGARLVQRNIGDIRNTGIDASVGARILDTRVALWQINSNIHKNTSKVISLAPGLTSSELASHSINDVRIVPGYPLYGRWARPILAYADTSRDGIIQPWEVTVGDTSIYVGAQEPNYELTFGTTVSLFNGRISINTAGAYQDGLTQEGASIVPTTPGLSFAEQAAIAAWTYGSYRTQIGRLQTVNTLRWTSLSINYEVPATITNRAHVGGLSIALQGSNLALKTNYRGKDPNVNAYATGNLVADQGQLPQPRVWVLRFTVRN